MTGRSRKDAAARRGPSPAPEAGPAPKRSRSVGSLLIVLGLTAVTLGYLLKSNFRSGGEPVATAATDQLDPDVRRVLDRQLRELQRDPSAANHGELGLVYEANEIWKEAERSLRMAAQLDPAQPLWNLHRAIVLRQLGDSGGSIELLRGVVRELPDSAAAHYRLADALLETHDVNGAVEHFREAARLAPERPEGHAGLGAALLDAKAAEEAVAALEKALARDPQYQAAHYLLGLAYRALGRKEDAARELALGVGGGRRALPDPLESHLARYRVDYASRVDGAVNLLEAGRLEDGIRGLEDLYAKRPDDVNVLNNLAVAYQMRGEREKALRLLEHARDIDETKFATWINLASCEMEMGRLDEALADSERAIQLAGTVGKAHLVRGLVLAQKGRLQEARASLQFAVGFEARDPEAHYALGRVLAMLGQPEEARASLETATRLAPMHLGATLELGRVYLHLGRRDEADRALAAARRIAPSDAGVLALAAQMGKQGER